jgi:hypothetical protein
LAIALAPDIPKAFQIDPNAIPYRASEVEPNAISPYNPEDSWWDNSTLIVIHPKPRHPKTIILVGKKSVSNSPIHPNY